VTDRSTGWLLVALAVSLLTALYGWGAGIGAPYREFPEDQLEVVGLGATAAVGLVVLAVLSDAELEAGRGVRVVGWVLATIVLLLPAFVVGNLFMPLDGYDALSCGSLFGIAYDVPTDPQSVGLCAADRSRRTQDVLTLAAAGAVASAALAFRLRQTGRRQQPV
jgi:hypothetical protein